MSLSFSTKLTLDVAGFKTGVKSVTSQLEQLQSKFESLDGAVDKFNEKLNDIGKGVNITQGTQSILKSLAKMFGKANVMAKENSAKIGKLMSDMKIDTSILDASIAKCLGSINGFVFLAKKKIKSLQGTLDVTEFSQRLTALAGIFDSAFANIQVKISEHLVGIRTLFDNIFSNDISNGVKFVCASITDDASKMAASVKESFEIVKKSIDNLDSLKSKINEKVVDTSTSAANDPAVKKRKKRGAAEVEAEKKTSAELNSLQAREDEIGDRYANRNNRKPSLSSSKDKAAPVPISTPRSVEEVTSGKTTIKDTENKAKQAANSQKTISEYLSNVHSTINAINSAFTGFISQLEVNDVKIKKGIDNMFKPFEEINRRFESLHEIASQLSVIFSGIRMEVKTFASQMKASFDVINDSLIKISGIGDKSKPLATATSKAYSTASEKSASAVKNIREEVKKLTDVTNDFATAAPKVKNAVTNINEGLKSIKLTKDDAGKAEIYVRHLRNMADAAEKLAAASSSLRGMKDFSYADSLIGKTKTNTKEASAVEEYAKKKADYAIGIADGLSNMSAKLEAGAASIQSSASIMEAKFNSMGWYVEQFLATMRGAAQPIGETSAAIKQMVLEMTQNVKNLGEQFQAINEIIVKSKALSAATKDLVEKNTGAVGASGKSQKDIRDEIDALAVAFERLSASLNLFKGKGNSLMSTIGKLTVPAKTIQNIKKLIDTLEDMGVKVGDLKEVASGAKAAFQGFGIGDKTSKAVSNLRNTINDYKDLSKIKPLPKETEESFDKIVVKIKEVAGSFEMFAPKMDAALKNIPAILDSLAARLTESFSKIESKFNSLGWYFEQFVATMRGSSAPIKDTTESLKHMVGELSVVVKELGEQFRTTNSYITTSKSLSSAAREAIGKNANLLSSKGRGENKTSVSTKDEVLGLASAFTALSSALSAFQGKGNSLMSTIKGITVPRKTIRNIQELSATLKTMGIGMADIKSVASSTRDAFKSFGFGSATSKNLLNIRDAVESYYKSVVKIRPLSKNIEAAFDIVGKSLEGNSTRIENAAIRLENAVNKMSARLSVLAKQLKRAAEYFVEFRASFRGISGDMGEANDPVKNLRIEVSALKNEAREAADQMRRINTPIHGGGGNNRNNNKNGNGSGGFFGNNGNKSLKSMSSGFGRISRAIITINSGLQTAQTLMAAFNIYPGQIAAGFIKAGMTVEDLSTRLLFLTGNTQKASALITSMGEFATKVPFDYKNVLESATRFAGIVQGDAVAETQKWMPMIADLAAVSGLTIEETTSQVIRMYSAGAQAADMFRERGILAMLGFKTGTKYAIKETQDMLMKAYTIDDSKIKGASKALADNMQGILSMIADKYFLFQNKVMEGGAFLTFKSIVGGYDLMWEAYSEQADSFAANFGKSIGEAFDFANESLITFFVTASSWLDGFSSGISAIQSLMSEDKWGVLFKTIKQGTFLAFLVGFSVAHPAIAAFVALADTISYAGDRIDKLKDADMEKWSENVLNFKDGFSGHDLSFEDRLSFDRFRDVLLAYGFEIKEFFADVSDSVRESVADMEATSGGLKLNNFEIAKPKVDIMQYDFNGELMYQLEEDAKNAKESWGEIVQFFVDFANKSADGIAIANSMTDESLSELSNTIDYHLNNQVDIINSGSSAVSNEISVWDSQMESMINNVSINTMFGFVDVQNSVSDGFSDLIKEWVNGSKNLAAALSSDGGIGDNTPGSLFAQTMFDRAYADSKSDGKKITSQVDYWKRNLKEINKRQTYLKQQIELAQNAKISAPQDQKGKYQALIDNYGFQLSRNFNSIDKLEWQIERDAQLKQQPSGEDDKGKKVSKERELDINDFLDQLRDAQREFDALGWSDFEKAKFDILSEFDDSKYKNASADIKAVIEQIKNQKLETLMATKAIEDNASAIQHQGDVAAESIPSWQSYSKELKSIITQFESSSVGASADKLKELNKEMERAIELLNAKTENGLLDQISDIQDEIALIGLTDKAREIEELRQKLSKIVDPNASKEIQELQKRLKELMVLRFEKSQVITFKDGVKDGLVNIENNFKTTGEAISQFMTDIFSGLSSGLEDVFFNIFKGNLKDAAEAMSSFADAIMQSVAQIMANQIAVQLMSGVGGMFGFSVQHAGGVVGSSYGVRRTRHVDPSMFIGAPRFHKGLMPDEFPAILQRGEMVIPKNGFSNSPSAKQDVTVNIRNESGEQLKVSKATTSGDMSQMVIDIVVDGIARNRSGLRTMLSASR